MKCNKLGEAEFKLIIPKRDNSKKPIKKQVLLKYVNKMNNIFGGSTTYPSVYGCYKNNSGKFQCENNFVITGVRDFQSKYNKELNQYRCSQRTRRLKQDYNRLKSLGLKASKELGQDAVMIESDFINDASFVGKKKAFKEKLSKNKTNRKIIDFEDFI